MGHGVSSGLRGGGAGATKIPLANGGYIDLTDMPLKYGRNDPAIDRKTRQELDRFEKAHRDDTDREYGLLLDKDGNVVDSTKGKNGEVSMSNDSYKKSKTMSHNHNRDNVGLLGGSFSTTDIDTFTSTNINTMRAAAKEGTYSISKQTNYRGTEFVQFIKRQRTKSVRERNKKIRELEAQVRSGTIKYIEYSTGVQRENNAHMVRMHNVYLANQEQFGYNYTLERRRK